jgi:hypothetical protein
MASSATRAAQAIVNPCGTTGNDVSAPFELNGPPAPDAPEARKSLSRRPFRAVQGASADEQ